MDKDLTNDDPNYPGLMEDLDGEPVHYSNGGYIEEVTPLLDGPGMLEIQHFYNPANGQPDMTQVWRPAFATDKAISNARITFTLPEQVRENLDAYVITSDTDSVNSRIRSWGNPYNKYTWQPLADRTIAHNEDGTVAVNDDGTITFDVGFMAAGTGTIFQFNIKQADESAFPANDPFVATATATAEYEAGLCPVPEQADPEPSNLERCEVEYVGRTIWNKYDRDITERKKYFFSGDGTQEVTDEFGETANDGWGLQIGSDIFNADAREYNKGATRTIRLYGGTHEALVDAEWTSEIISGATFGPTFTYYGPENRWTLANFETRAPFPESPQRDSATEISVSGVDMPEDSWFAYNNTISLAGEPEEPVVMVHRLRGTLEDCDPTEPTPPTDPTPPADPTPPGGSTPGIIPVPVPVPTPGSSEPSTPTPDAPVGEAETPHANAPKAPEDVQKVPEGTQKVTGDAPTTQSESRPQLANTGASVLGLAAVAGLLIVAGLFLMNRRNQQEG
ncbi:LPXTG cell wall anchor domain-containing protein [Corynebacterium camporealensis]